VAVIIADNPSVNKTLTLAEAWATRRAGIGLVTVGVGTNLDLYELSAIASYPFSRNMMTVSTIRNIATFTDAIKRTICSDDGICSSTVCQNGGSCVESMNTISCQCPAGFGGDRCQFGCQHAADVVFALDVSGSIEQLNFQRMTSFVGDIIQSLFINGATTTSRVGLVTFSDSATVQFQLNSYTTKAELLQAVNVPYSMGATNTAQAIQVARDVMFKDANGDRAGVANYLIILTDGMSDNTTLTWVEAMKARSQGINILTIGIGNQFNVKELVSVASAPSSSNVLLAANFTTLTDDIRNAVAGSLCANVNECQSNPCQNGASCTDLMGGYSCSACPAAFTGFNCERQCSGQLDLTFILDSAGTVHGERWHYMTDFVAGVVSQLDIAADRTRVAAIYYSDTAYTGFTLNTYTVRQDVIQAVLNLPYLGGRTNTMSALNMLRTTIYQASNGDRASTPNIAILIANGESTMNADQVASAATACRNAGITLLTVVAESLMCNSSEMLSIVSSPVQRNMFVTPTVSLLSNVSNAVLAATCNSVNECQSSPCQNSGTCVDDYGRYLCRCPSSYTGYNCQRACDVRLDVVFVIDISGSIQQEYVNAINLATAVSYGLDVDSGSVRIGAVAYSTSVVAQFYLNDYTTSREAVVNALRFDNIGGATDTADALDTALNTQFTAPHGARSAVKKVVIIITDGYSNVKADQTLSRAQALKDAGVLVYSVGNGDSQQMSELLALASTPSTDFMFAINSPDDIDSVANSLLDKLCAL
jgi:collagen type VI alpha